MINFVLQDQKRSLAIEKTKKSVIFWTSLVLGLYVVGMAGFLGWKVYWKTKEKKFVTEETQLRQEINALSESENLAIRLSDRADEINKFITERGKIAEKANQMPKDGFLIFKWVYGLGGTSEISVIGQSPTHLKEYEDYLRGFYDEVQVGGVIFDPEVGWTEILLVSKWKGK